MAEARRRKGLHVQNLIAISVSHRATSLDARAVPLTAGLARLTALWVAPAEVRAETWALGVRHGGRVIEGAREEGRAAGLSFRRAILLKAVIRAHGRAMRDEAGRPADDGA